MWTKLWKTGVTVLMLVASLAGCATGHYTPLGEAEKTEIAQLKENVYRVEYRVSAFTSQEQLDFYLRRRCAELTLREGYDFFHLARRADVLGLSRRTAMTVTLYKGQKPVGVADLYDAKDVLAETATKRTSEKAGSLPAHGFAPTARVEGIWTGAPGQQRVRMAVRSDSVVVRRYRPQVPRPIGRRCPVREKEHVKSLRTEIQPIACPIPPDKTRCAPNSAIVT